MIVANFVTQRPTLSETRTYEDFYKFLGARPHKLGVVSRLYPENTATYLTESLKNVFYNDKKGANRFQSVDSMMFEWEVISFARYHSNMIDESSKIGEVLQNHWIIPS